MRGVAYKTDNSGSNGIRICRRSILGKKYYRGGLKIPAFRIQESNRFTTPADFLSYLCPALVVGQK